MEFHIVATCAACCIMQHVVHVVAHVATMWNSSLFMILVVKAQAFIALGALRLAPPDVLGVHAQRARPGHQAVQCSVPRVR